MKVQSVTVQGVLQDAEKVLLARTAMYLAVSIVLRKTTVHAAIKRGNACMVANKAGTFHIVISIAV